MILKDIPTWIAEGTRLHGDFTFSTETQILGLIEGNITQQCTEPLSIGRNGWVHGSISSQGPVLVHGKMEGTIYCVSAIRLLPTATVRGTLVAPRIEIQAGALFNGELKMRWESSLPAIQKLAG